MSGQLCADGCGRPVLAKGYAHPCYYRWTAAGRPESGPPAPMSPATAGALSHSPREDRQEAAQPDDADLAWERERRIRLAVTQLGRLARARSQAAALTYCAAAGDRKGIRELSLRIEDWDTVRALVVAGGATLAAAGRAPLRVASDMPGSSAAILTRSEGESDAA